LKKIEGDSGGGKLCWLMRASKNLRYKYTTTTKKNHQRKSLFGVALSDTY